jgi:hypothetical protein
MRSCFLVKNDRLTSHVRLTDVGLNGLADGPTTSCRLQPTRLVANVRRNIARSGKATNNGERSMALRRMLG